MYNTSDADGYVVYYSTCTCTAKLHVSLNVIAEGGDTKEVTLYGLIPGVSYSITVRAYQDILGPPSLPLYVTTNNDGKNH